MKRTMTILTLISAGVLTCHGQKNVSMGTDIASCVLYGRINLNTTYAFCEKWSAGADVYVNASNMFKGPDSEEIEHWSELYGNMERKSYIDFVETGICVSYWPKQAFQGPTISIGSCVKDRSGPDMTAALGYYCRICKGLAAVLMYRICILESLNKRSEPVEGLRIGISYAF